MSVLRSIVMAFSLFSRIPMPQVDWSGHNRRFMMAAFPAVGALIGACLWGWWQLSSLLGFGAILRAAGLTLIPLGITGGMHLDGLADVVDARSSYAEPAKRREILKDPHVGAFAVMGVCGYLIAYLSLASEVNPRFLVSLICAPILSRCLSGYATITFKKASTDGMLAAEGSTSAAAAVRLVLLGVFGLTACGNNEGQASNAPDAAEEEMRGNFSRNIPAQMSPPLIIRRYRLKKQRNIMQKP